MHSSGHGGVSSPWASTVPGMALQCLGWWHSGRDGRIGPEVMEETHSTGLTSQRRPGGRGVDGRTLFEGSAVLFRGVRHGDGTGVGGTVSRN
jgi:hypothetical protein